MTLQSLLKNQTILVTGGTGSFGKSFVRHVLESQPVKKVIVFSRDEMKQYEMSKEFDAHRDRLRFFLGDVRDPDRLHRAFQGIDVVIHAAALKIVPMLEYNPFEAVQTNVIGAENVINLAIDNQVKRVIALSTDKAVNPINLYGATKLCAEKMFTFANNYSPKGTKFSVVRYGNVFGSRGSVVLFFKECRKKGVVYITDERMTRFWITLADGVKLVLDALTEMQGGEIFVPKIPSLHVTDLADVLCPGCKREIIGIRPGEKLHETLISCDEGISAFEFPEKFVIMPRVIASAAKNEAGPEGKPLGPEYPGYRSDQNDRWLTPGDLKRMIGEEKP